MTASRSTNPFTKEENRLKAKNRIITELNQITELSYTSLEVDADGFIKCDIDDKEKAEAMGELGRWKTVYVFYDGESMEELVSQFLNNVEQTLKDIRTKWEEAKKIHQKAFPDNKSVVRNRAIQFAKIYQEILYEK